MLQGKPWALKRENPALQSMKFLNFFLFLWVILPSWIRIRTPDPLTWLNPDPDPKHCMSPLVKCMDLLEIQTFVCYLLYGYVVFSVLVETASKAFILLPGRKILFLQIHSEKMLSSGSIFSKQIICIYFHGSRILLILASKDYISE
jgi:hypothetical protein